MRFFDKIFRPTSLAAPTTEAAAPSVAFGRYSDGNKSPQQLADWNASMAAFDRQDFVIAFDHFFRYLKDAAEENVFVERQNGRVHFVIFQGSNRVSGFANERWLRAEAKLAKADMLNVGFMRRLLEQNFALKYGRYALDGDNNIVLIFDSYTLDCSPYKLYYALREIALLADKQDDLLLDEFKMLQPATPSAGLQITISEQEKKVKYDFVVSQINAVLTQINHIDAERNAPAVAYLLLHLCYKLDYLVKPEGVMMETLERVHRTFFSNEEKTSLQKNNAVRREFEQLLLRSKSDFLKEFYRTKATFGLTNTTTHEQLLSFIGGELKNLESYANHPNEAVELAIMGYAVAFSLFNYALLAPDTALLHLYLEILESDYFQSLGYSLPHADLGAPKLVRQRVKDVAKANSDKFPKFCPNTDRLDFNSKAAFAKSYLQMLLQTIV